MKINQDAFNNVVRVIVEKILSLDGVDQNKVNKHEILELAKKVALDLQMMNYIDYKEWGLFHEFTASQLANNCRVGELQVYFDEYLGTKVIVTRYGDEELKDIQVKLINYNQDVLAVVETLGDKTYTIRDDFGRELRFQGGTLKFQAEDKTFTEFLNVNDIDLPTFIDCFRTRKIDALVKMGSSALELDEGPKLQ